MLRMPSPPPTPTVPPIDKSHMKRLLAGENNPIPESQITAWNLMKIIRSPTIPREFVVIHPNPKDDERNPNSDISWGDVNEGKNDRAINLNLSQEDGRVINQVWKRARKGQSRTDVVRKIMVVGTVWLAGKLMDFRGPEEFVTLSETPNEFIKRVSDICPPVMLDTTSGDRTKVYMAYNMMSYIRRHIIRHLYNTPPPLAYRLCFKAGVQFYHENENTRKQCEKMVKDVIDQMIEWEEYVMMFREGFQSVIDRYGDDMDDSFGPMGFDIGH